LEVSVKKYVIKNVTKLALLVAALGSCLALFACSQPADGQRVPAIAPAGMEAKRASAPAALGTDAPKQESDASPSPSPQPTHTPAAQPTVAQSSPTPLDEAAPVSPSPEYEEALCAVDFAGQGKRMGDVWVFQSFDEGLVGDEYLHVSLIHVGNEAGELLWSLDLQAPVTELDTISEVFPCRDMLYIQIQGNLQAYDMLTGRERFVIPGVGASISYGFGPDDILYISGYYGPLLTAVSPEGETLFRIDSAQLDEEVQFIWPHQVEVIDGMVQVLGEGDGQPLLLISDFSGNYTVEKKYPGESMRFISEEHGFSLTLPASWQGLYNVVSAEDGLVFEYLHKVQEGEFLKETRLYMFSISDDYTMALNDKDVVDIGVIGDRTFYYLQEREPESDIPEQMQAMLSDAYYIMHSFEAVD
jgi:hypothetical protein